MAHLSGTRVDLDEVSIARLCVEHKIKTIDTGESQVAGHFLGGSSHLRMLDAAENGGMSGGVTLLKDCKVETGQNGALPAGQESGGFLPDNEGLCVYCGAGATQRRPHQSGVVVEQ